MLIGQYLCMQRLFILPESHDRSRSYEAAQLAFSLSKHVKTALFLEGRMGDQAATDKTPFDVISIEHPAIISSICCLSAAEAASTLNAFTWASHNREGESFMGKIEAAVSNFQKHSAREFVLGNVRYVSTLLGPEEKDEFDQVCREVDSVHGGIPPSLKAAVRKWVGKAAESSSRIFESLSEEINGFFKERFQFETDDFRIDFQRKLSALESCDSLGLAAEVSELFRRQNSFREAYMAFRIARADATVGVLNIGGAHSERSYLASLLDLTIGSIKRISTEEFERLAKTPT